MEVCIWAEVISRNLAAQVEGAISRADILVTTSLSVQFPVADSLASRMASFSSEGVLVVAETPSARLKWVLQEMGQRQFVLDEEEIVQVYRAFVTPAVGHDLSKSWTWVRELSDDHDLIREVHDFCGVIRSRFTKT